ncbi:hypothetical protein BpHYR1_051435 [Brachionus plicatilis]|uniref:Uncharacterized protein n=1 Tax=Brachionus plicatilis TaxID=10195 RepID=A0A3M7SZL6_BRAPC|nr:hypothetical protein BpHYR1_051435 [Brachionus plicatilis]
MPNRILYSLCLSNSHIVPPIFTSSASVFPQTSTFLSSASMTLVSSGQKLIPFFIAQSSAIIDIVAPLSKTILSTFFLFIRPLVINKLVESAKSDTQFIFSSSVSFEFLV